MNERDFVYWLSGFLELSGSPDMDAEQLAVVREHLALVIRKKTTASVPIKAPTTPSINGMSNSPASFFGGISCGVCGRLCTNEGGTCRTCMQGVTTGDTLGHVASGLGVAPESHAGDTPGSLVPLCTSSLGAEEAKPAEPEVLDVDLHPTS